MGSTAFVFIKRQEFQQVNYFKYLSTIIDSDKSPLSRLDKSFFLSPRDAAEPQWQRTHYALPPHVFVSRDELNQDRLVHRKRIRPKRQPRRIMTPPQLFTHHSSCCHVAGGSRFLGRILGTTVKGVMCVVCGG